MTTDNRITIYGSKTSYTTLGGITTLDPTDGLAIRLQLAWQKGPVQLVIEDADKMDLPTQLKLKKIIHPYQKRLALTLNSPADGVIGPLREYVR